MKKLKISYIGNFEPEFSTENDVRKAFEYLGHEVIRLQENRINLSQVRQVALDSDMLLITSTWDNALDLRGMLDIFYECAKKGIPTATLHLDVFWGTGRGGRQWWLNPMFHTAFVFTVDGDHDIEWKNYGKNHVYLPPGIRHDAAHFGKFREEYACDVSFVGSNGSGYHEDVWPDRRILVDNLRAMCQRNGWIFKNPGGDNPKIMRSDDMNDFYASCKVSVGDSLCHLREKSRYWSDRLPEATGRGATLIMPQIDAITDIYGDSVAMYPWNDFAALEEKIKYLLDNPKVREEMSKKAQTISAKDHTYVNRIKIILKETSLSE